MNYKRPLPFRLIRGLLYTAAILLTGSFLQAEESATVQPPADLDIYLLIGQSNMAGRAPIPEDAKGTLDRCWLLNAEGKWEPASNPLNIYSSIRKGEGMQKLNPGYSFAKRMLEANPNRHIGLIVNARGGSKIEQWQKNSKYYREIQNRTKAAIGTGQIKGVLWHQGESNSRAPETYLAQLTTFIATIRGDLEDPNLPFVAGQITNTPPMPINEEIAKLPDAVHFTAIASSEDLSTYDRWHFDTKSQLLLGERYAEAMLKLQQN